MSRLLRMRRTESLTKTLTSIINAAHMVIQLRSIYWGLAIGPITHILGVSDIKVTPTGRPGSLRGDSDVLAVYAASRTCGDCQVRVRRRGAANSGHPDLQARPLSCRAESALASQHHSC